MPYLYTIVELDQWTQFLNDNTEVFTAIKNAKMSEFSSLPAYTGPILQVGEVIKSDDLKEKIKNFTKPVVISIEADTIGADEITWTDDNIGTITTRLSPSQFWARPVDVSKESQEFVLGDLSKQVNIYKLLEKEAYEAFIAKGSTKGGPLDFRPEDSPPFMHVSAKEEVYPALGRFYKEKDVIAVAIPFDKVKFEVRWKWAAGRAYFPHLLRHLTTDDVCCTYLIQWDGDKHATVALP